MVLTKEQLINRMYGSQKGCSKTRGHNPPTYSREELSEWCMSQHKFHKLYDAWVSGGCQKDDIPSVDRKDDKTGYTMKNIQLMTWYQNRMKAYATKPYKEDARRETLRVRIETKDREVLDAVAKERGISVADLLRKAIVEEYEREVA